MSDQNDVSKGKAETPEGQSRPVTAAARRQRRSSAQPAESVKPASASAAKSGGKNKATPKRDRKAKNASVFARLARFFREVVAELRKVVWPTRKQMITYTTVVLVFVAFMIALVSGLDFVFRKGVFWLFG